MEYQYEYAVSVRTLFNATSKNESTLFIRAIVNINMVSNCDGLLTLTNARLSDKPIEDKENKDLTLGPKLRTNRENVLFLEDMTEFTVRFSFQDGIINEVCSNEDEKTWILNFKKGLLSILHNSMKRLDLDHTGEEQDINGKCNVMYKVLGPNITSLVIEKTKNLTYCEDRYRLHSMVQSNPYNFKSVSTF